MTGAARSARTLRIQLWSYNYHPEPSGIAPVSRAVARQLAARGHDVSVVAAHPHYPAPTWGARKRPYRERRDGIPVFRLPIAIGRDTAKARLRQELSYVAALCLAMPFLPRPDVILAATPSFPALAPVIALSRSRGVPWVCWLHDLLPDGAVSTGLLHPGRFLDAMYRYERAAYDSASHIVAMAQGTADAVLAKGVPSEKVHTIMHPSPVPLDETFTPPVSTDGGRRRMLIMGNIGLTQHIPETVAAIQESGVLDRLDLELRIAGAGVDEERVRAAITTPRVKLLGVLMRDEIEAELRGTHLGLITQRPDLREFNFPSKTQNFTAHGIPLVAITSPDAQAAMLIREAGCGWVADAGRLDEVGTVIEEALGDPAELERRARASLAYAYERFEPARVAGRFEALLQDAAERARAR